MLDKRIDRDNPVPLYVQIKNDIIADMDREVFKAGDTFPSLSNLSKKYKVSMITSRRVISDLVTEGYLKTSQGHKTIVADKGYKKVLIPGLKKNIGIVFSASGSAPEIDAAKMPWTNEIFTGIQHCLNEAGFFSTLIPLENEKDGALKTLSECMDNFDGFILFPAHAWINRCVELLANNGKAYVLIDRLNENTVNNYVSVDYYNGSREAAEYLFSLGIKSYLILIWNINHYANFSKMRGFQETLMKNGVSPRCINIIETGSIDVETGFKVTASYLEENRDNIPGAIFAAGDYLAWGAMQACEKNGLRVPEDISIIGGTGLEAVKLVKPSLAVLHTPMLEMGETAAKILLRIMKTKNRHQPGIMLPMRFIVRDSVLQKTFEHEKVLKAENY